MSDDLGRRLETLTQRLSDGSPDMGAVVAGGRRLHRRRLMATTASIVGLVSVLVVAAVNLDLGARTPAPVRPATHDDGVFVPAEPGEPTYILTAFEIKYPWAKVDGIPGMRRPGSERREHYCSIRKADCQSEGNAGFFYEWEWATNQFPGDVMCRVILYSKEGEPVGRADWGLTGGERSSRRPDDVLVHVSAKPARAEAACEAGTYEGGPGYRFTYIGSETYDPGMDLPRRIGLLFDVEVLTEHDPSTRQCTLRVRFESGKVIKEGSMTFGGMREGPFQMRTGFPASDPVEDARMTCRPLRSEPRQTSKSSHGYVTVVIDNRDGCLAEPSTPRKYRVEVKFPKGSQPTRSCP